MEKVTQELDITQVKKKTLRGVVALTSRTFILQIIAFGATFLLTVFLTPSIFGIFYVVSAIISFFTYFSDIGLAAALIQKKEELTQDDLTTTFTIQQALVGAIVILAVLFSGQIGRFFGLEQEGIHLFLALVFSFFLSSLKTIPSVLLERKLDFHTLVVPQILETLVFYSIAVVLAWKGSGVASFTWAVSLRAVVGLVAIYVLAPWKISLGFQPVVAKRLLRFGLPFQVNSFLALLKDDLLTIFLAKILPLAHIGYIGWAKKWAEVPLRLVMDSVVRVTFPAFARIQHSRELLGKAVEKILFGIAVLMLPITVGLIFFAGPLVSIIPKYEKWEPALISFYLFAGASLIAGFTTPLTNALNAVGKIKLTLSLMVFWTLSTWILVPLGIYLWGYTGVSVALFVITFSIVWVIRLMKRYAEFSFVSSVWRPGLSAIFQIGLYMLLLSWGGHDLIRLSLVGFSGIILYGVLVYYLESKRIKEFIALWKVR